MDHACPLCESSTASGTCGGCGVSWIRCEHLEAVAPAASHPQRSRVRLPPASLLWVALPASVATLGAVSLWGAIHPLQVGPNGWFGWTAAVVGVLLGCILVVPGVTWLVQMLLHAAIPGRLDHTSDGLRVRVWTTWKGLWDGFRRIDVTIPAQDFAGVMFGVSQGRQTSLFVAHASGLALSTGWEGPRPQALALAAALQRSERVDERLTH